MIARDVGVFEVQQECVGLCFAFDLFACFASLSQNHECVHVNVCVCMCCVLLSCTQLDMLMIESRIRLDHCLPQALAALVSCLYQLFQQILSQKRL
jgi:hypothetical protein